MDKKLLVIVILCLLYFPVVGQTRPFGFNLSADSFKNDSTLNLNDSAWRYQAGDDMTWANPEFDDSGWQPINPPNVAAHNAAPWTGRGWFRTVINVDELMAQQPVSLIMYHLGASEIYLDGRLIQGFGKITETGDVEVNPRGAPVPLIFSGTGRHVIALRYSFQAVSANTFWSRQLGNWLRLGQFTPGIYSYLRPGFLAVNSYTTQQLEFNEYKLYSGVLAAFACLHFFLFIFFPRERANIYYSVFAFALSIGNALSNNYNNSRQSALITAITFIFFVILYSSSFVALTAFLHVAFDRKFSKFFYFLCIYLGLLIVVVVIFSRADFTLYIVIGLIILSIIDTLRILWQALRNGRSGARIIMAGVGIFVIGVGMLLARELNLINWLGNFETFRNCALYLAIPVAVSIYLARNFASVNRNLAGKLIEVELLSARAIDHEKEKARLLLVEAENERRTKELEEARRLQFSMLPKKLPNIPNVEIAVYMKPASEVGGDYYDFHVGENGSLTVAIGDATGHGLKAGTMVTATKSLFNNLAHEPDIENIFRKSSAALKKMNMRGMFMAMMMVKIKDQQVYMGCAGMPSALIYRAGNHEVEEIALRALPWGSPLTTAYPTREFKLESGDCILLMSDGFPEMFNQQGEMLGFEKAHDLLVANAGKSSQEIINRFVEAGTAWAGTRPPDDDVTFVVLKIK